MQRKYQTIAGAIVAALILGAIFWAWQAREEKNVSRAPVKAGLEDGFRDLRREVRKNFEQAAEMLNSQAAEHANEPARLAKAEVGDGPSMIYHYALRRSETAVPAEADARAVLLEQTCAVPEMRDYMQYGVYYVFVYADETEELFRVRVDEEACKRHEEAAAASGAQQPAATEAGTEAAPGGQPSRE
ncbi:MAG: hypothetical protein Q4F72_04290 [Desulfovibrionaceae bacterium]|nr:hypothetical protein [Desulfovibrionaceae bacterium]